MLHDKDVVMSCGMEVENAFMKYADFFLCKVRVLKTVIFFLVPLKGGRASPVPPPSLRPSSFLSVYFTV